MKIFSKKNIALAAAALTIAATQFMGSAKSPRRTAGESNADKADYMLMEALRYKAIDSLDAYHDLLGRAYSLNPSDLFIGKEYGLMEIIMGFPEDSARTQNGVDLMLRYITQTPDDQITGLGFVRLANNMGDTDNSLKVLRLLYENAKDPVVAGSAYAGALSYLSDPDSLRKAIDIMNRVESFEGKSVDSSVDKMRCYLSMGDTAAIFNEAHRLLNSSPNSVEYLTFTGNVYQQFDMPDSALYYFNRAVDTDPTNGYAYYWRAQYYNSIGDSVAYDREVFQALRHPDLDLQPKLGILREYVAQLYDDESQRDRISEMFQSLVEQYPHEEEVRKIYGSYLYLINDLKGAAEQYDYVVSLNPDEVESWGMLGQMYYSASEYDKAEAAMVSALKYFPKEMDLYLLASSAASSQQAFDRADSFLNRALELADTTDAAVMSSIYGAKGDVAYSRKAPVDSVMKYYNEAFRYDSENSVLLNNLAYYMACSNTDLDKALEYVEKALMLEKEKTGEQSPTTLDTYAWVLFKRKDFPKAREVIDMVLELDEDGGSADLLEHAGDIYFMNGEPAEALGFWKQALELDPDNELLQRKVKNKTFFFE